MYVLLFLVLLPICVLIELLKLNKQPAVCVKTNNKLWRF